MTAAIIMVSVAINPLMMIPSFVIIAFFIALRYIFAKTSQGLQRIEAICKYLSFTPVLYIK